MAYCKPACIALQLGNQQVTGNTKTRLGICKIACDIRDTMSVHFDGSMQQIFRIALVFRTLQTPCLRWKRYYTISAATQTQPHHPFRRSCSTQEGQDASSSNASFQDATPCAPNAMQYAAKKSPRHFRRKQCCHVQPPIATAETLPHACSC